MTIKPVYCILAILALSALIAFFSPAASVGIMFALALLGVSIKNPFWGILFLALYTPLEPFLLKFVSDDMYPFLRYGGEVFMVILLGMVILRHVIPAKAGIQARSRFSTGQRLDPGRSLSRVPPRDRDDNPITQLLNYPITIPLVAFLCIAAISMLVNPVDPFYVGFFGLRQLLRYVVLFYVVVYAGLTKRDVHVLIATLLGLALFESMLGLLQAFAGDLLDNFLLPGKAREFPLLETVEKFWGEGQRVFATMGRYDRLGTFLSFFLSIAAGIAWQLKNVRAKKILIIGMALALPGFILTYSRLSWLGLFMGLCVMGICIKRSKWFTVSLLSGVSLIIVYLVSYVVLTGVQPHRIIDQPLMSPAARILEAVSPRALREGYRGYGRPYFIINVPQKLILKHPLVGVGPGQFGGGVASALHLTAAYDEAGLPFGVAGVLGQIDNNWFSIAGEVGILGALAFLWMLVALLYAAYTTFRTSTDALVQGLSLGFIGALCGLVFESFFGPYFEVRTVSMYLWLLGGIIVGIQINEFKTNPTNTTNDSLDSVSHS